MGGESTHERSRVHGRVSVRAHYVPSQWYPGGFCQLLAVAVTALVHKWKHNTFLSIILGTALYMLLIRTL